MKVGNNYNSVLSNILDAQAPLITRQVQVRQHSPWFTGSIREAKRERRRAKWGWPSEKTQGNIDALQFAGAGVNGLCTSA